ncbi:g13316 [Coccomyxa viridis]|uniref:G13316 protein n=1 Tax=Coccomyxa viridis TaxID=1274662 RepID=A0ABP1GHY5_9CHLO
MSDNAAKLAELYAGFKGQFPKVKPITVKELHDELQRPNGQSIILLDIRTPQEWEVSRLPGNVLTTDAFETVREDTAKSAPLVTYCTAGLRSGKYAEGLLKEGFTDVRNLEGSILAWTQAGYPLVKQDQSPTTDVHVFSKDWALQGDGYHGVYFSKGGGALATVRAGLPSWLGGIRRS